MSDKDYQFEFYRTDFLPAVADLLRYLVGDDLERNLSYLKWKYHDNPYADKPLGVVALHGGKAVGFRGYFVTRWQIPSRTDRVLVLCPGDTCVHPDHRLKGLSVLMGNRAMEGYGREYKILLNLTSTKNSFPGYRKMGFFPLARKTYLSQYSPFGFIRFLLTTRKKSVSDPLRVPVGEFHDVVVSDLPRPEEMHAVISAQHPADEAKLVLYEDVNFFAWRFGNIVNRYLFYYLRGPLGIDAYLVMGLSPSTRRAFILDFAERIKGGIEKILVHVLEKKHFDVLSVYRFSLGLDHLHNFSVLGFKANGWLQQLEKKIKGDLPLLVRPVKKKFDAEDLFIEGLDIRKPENWMIKGICSDAA